MLYVAIRKGVLGIPGRVWALDSLSENLGEAVELLIYGACSRQSLLQRDLHQPVSPQNHHRPELPSLDKFHSLYSHSGG